MGSMPTCHCCWTKTQAFPPGLARLSARAITVKVRHDLNQKHQQSTFVWRTLLLDVVIFDDVDFPDVPDQIPSLTILRIKVKVLARCKCFDKNTECYITESLVYLA